jgi:hypothetical protein
MGKWPRLAFVAVAVAVASVVAVLSIAPEEHLALTRIDDLKPIESSGAGSVCDNVYSITKLHYDQICGTYQKMGEARVGSSGNSRVAVRMLDCFDGVTWVMEALAADRWGAVMRTCRPMGEGKGAPPLNLDDLGKAMIQIVRQKFPDLDLAARAERTDSTP